MMGENTMAGCWEYPEMGACNLPEEAKAALELALQGYVGMDVTPVFYLGQQVVSGKNFGFLCQVKPLVRLPDTELKVIVVNQDAQGNCVIDRMYNAIQNRPDMENGAFGGWEYPKNLQPGNLPEKAATAFTAAKAELLGVDLTPLCYLGQQLVAGVNYGVLCLAKSVTNPPVESLKVVVVYENLEHTSEIFFIYDIIQDKSK